MRLVLVFMGPGPYPENDYRAIEQLPGLTIVRTDGSKVVVADADSRTKKLVEKMPGWIAAEETALPAPGPRLR